MASIAIIGSGFVGQANGKVLAQQGHRVLFADINPAKLAQLREEGYRTRTLEEIKKEEHIDICLVAVPTPTVGEEVQLIAIKEAAQYLGGLLSSLNNYPIIILKSTVPPGTTRSVFIPILEEYSRKRSGYDFGVVFEPEYLRQVTSLEDAQMPRAITIGSFDQQTASVVAWLRAPFHCPVHHVSPEAAELQKYVHNLYNATKISFFNEMRRIGKLLNIEDTDKIFEVTAQTAEASWNPRYGVRDFGPFGGTCLPKDTSGFLHFSREVLHTDMPLLSATIEVNDNLLEKSPIAKTPGQTLLPQTTEQDTLVLSAKDG
jgi:UDPglucose 6-dehydrogenase